VRFLLDEDVDVGLVTILRALGQEADHIAGLGRQGSPDEAVVAIAVDYDVLVTIDLHRQEAEWVAVNEAMLGSIRVIRMKFSKNERTELLDQARMLLARWRDWMHDLEAAGARLVTLSGVGGRVRSLSADQVAALLTGRRGT
jgi:hypothetical protein